MSRSQLRVMAILAGPVLVVALLSGVLAQRGLRERELARIARSLEERAALVIEASRGVDFAAAATPTLDTLADRSGAAAQARVTLIDAQGHVVGDSQVPAERLPEVENHGDRPEVREALAGRVGRSERQSRTVGRPSLYVALPVQEGRGGVVRVSIDLSDVATAVAELRHVLLFAGALGLLAALALSYPLAWYSLRPLREIRRLTAAVSGGNLDYRLPRRVADEHGDIADAVQGLAEQLRERLADATAEKERLEAVLEGMTEGVLVVDSDGTIALANRPLREFFGSHREPQGRAVLEGVRNAELAEILAYAQQDDAPVVQTLELSHPAPRTLQVHAVRRPIGTVAVFHDVTELTALERMRREFVANASHELRTPLSAIRGFAETLLGRPELSGQERRSYLEVIDRHALRLGKLVSDLLDLSQAENTDAPTELEPVDLLAVLDAWIADHRSRIAERGVELLRKAEGETLAWADRQAVERILGNLLDNALQYTDEGGRIEVAIREDGEWVRVKVCDNGIGIPSADLARIFERFYRVDKARSRAQGGTGLGLAIVKHLVQSLGGEIRVESQRGKGTCFHVTLKRAAPAG